MRIGDEWLCDTLTEEGCERNAAVAFFCRIEGMQVALCRPCDTRWKALARSDAGLANRCPKCASRYIDSRASATAAIQAKNRPLPASTEPLQGTLADAIEQAMFAEGLLVNARRRVLQRLSLDPLVQATIVDAAGAMRAKAHLSGLQEKIGRYTEVDAQSIMDLFDPEGMWRLEAAEAADTGAA
jgi:hypothetical protein